MLNPTRNPQTHRQDNFTILDVCGGIVVLLIFLVPTILFVIYLGHASRFIADMVQTIMHSATLQGAGLC